MNEHADILKWVESQEQTMKALAVEWAEINSHTYNLSGLQTLSKKLKTAFSIFSGDVKFIDLPDYERINNHGEIIHQKIAPALSLHIRPQAPKQALLVIHMDTVYSPENSFQEVKHLSDEKIGGPGITDAKGGIVVMLKALEAFEQSPLAQNVGWRVIINTDEEIGSPSSTAFIQEAAKLFHIGLVFEPCLPNGDLVGARKGSGNFTLIAHGTAAHAGRDHAQGRNAILALSESIVKISNLSYTRPGLTVNVGTVQGGSAFNVVPDLAIAQYNVRYAKEADQKYINEQIDDIIHKTAKEHDVRIEVQGKFQAPAKPLTKETLSLFHHIQSCGKEIDLDIHWADSGGVCDGNRLQAVGLPTVDTLGVQGGDIHSENEYLIMSSLVKRTKLTALALLKWANDDWNI